MEQITMYKAKDGETFETLEECLEHERQTYPLDGGLNDLCLWDQDMRPIVLDGTRSYDELYDNLQWFMLKKITYSSLDCIMRILAEGCYSYPKEFVEGDVYTWADTTGWYNYSKKFREMKDNLEIIHGSTFAEENPHPCEPYICESCVFGPPSSGDGKPCSTCDPCDPLLNCYIRKANNEDTFRHDNWVDTRSMTAVDKAVKL